MSYAFVSYSSHVAEHLLGLGVELAGKNDLRFVETAYKVSHDFEEAQTGGGVSRRDALRIGSLYAGRHFQVLFHAAQTRAALPPPLGPRACMKGLSYLPSLRPGMSECFQLLPYSA